MKAAIKWEGKGNYFVFQWADGGNLWDFYQTDPKPVLNAKFVREIVSQLWGISTALNQLHNFKKDHRENGSYRHGDLKPENIVRFDNGTAVGLLKISDLGSAKYHINETELRGPTETRYGTLSYEPPEAMLEPDLARSRRYDIWSIGCVFLELLVWLLYGYDELRQFNKRLHSRLQNVSRFWVMKETEGPESSASVHPIIVELMEIMGKELARVGPTAIGDLLEMVKTRLLVVPLARSTGQSGSSFSAPPVGRATASDLEVELKRILEKANRDERYAYARITGPGSVDPLRSIKRATMAPSRVPIDASIVTRGNHSPSSSDQLAAPIIGPPTTNFLSRHNTPGVSTKYARIRHAAEIGSLSLEEHGQPSASPRHLTRAIESHNRIQVRWLLQTYFDQIAVQEYSWLAELVKLGFSHLEIADELLDTAMQGPWIHEPFETPRSEPSKTDFHQPDCVHVDSLTPSISYVGNPSEFIESARVRDIVVGDSGHDEKDSQYSDPDSQGILDIKGISPTSGLESNSRMALTPRQRIEYFCGLGGVRPASNGSANIEFGSVSFGDNNSTASIAFDGSKDNSVQVVLEVLDSISRAAGELQRLGGCCNSFSILLDFVSKDYVELHRIPLLTIQKLRELVLNPDMTGDSGTPYECFYDVFGWAGLIDNDMFETDHLHWVSLATQFLALGFLSYAQAHCGSIQPFFLDTPLQTIRLLGSSNSRPRASRTLTSYLVELTCMGDMLGQPVVAFGWLPGSAPDAKQAMPLARRKDIRASPVDILDTWGPGYMVASANDPNVLYSFSVGGGTITSTGTSVTPQLHWSREVVEATRTTSTFRRNEKAIVGATIIENFECQSAADRLRDSYDMLQELGTFPSYWEVMERQVGIGAQVGQIALALFEAQQGWVKMQGVTKKSRMLSVPTIYLSDLNGMFGVQVSICTGIARRVRLRDLLADLLPVYVSNLFVKPPLWRDLVGDNAIEALRGAGLEQWLESLSDDGSRSDFARLVFEVLFLLRDTGIDRKGEKFVIACLQQDSGSQCFKVPCENESSWARMLIDSEHSATFAYATTRCLETPAFRCWRALPKWTNSTALMGTAVLEDAVATGNAVIEFPGPRPWSLRENEMYYLMGQSDRKLYVQVRRPTGLDPHLLLSSSTIPRTNFVRLLMRGKLKRLREKKYSERSTESVVVCDGNTDIGGTT